MQGRQGNEVLPLASGIAPLDVAPLYPKLYLLAVSAGDVLQGNQRPPGLVPLPGIAPEDGGAVIFQLYLPAVRTGLTFQVGEGHQILPGGVGAGGITPLDVAPIHPKLHFSAVGTVSAAAAGDGIQRHQVTPGIVVLPCIPPLDMGAVVPQLHFPAILTILTAIPGYRQLHQIAGIVGLVVIVTLLIEDVHLAALRQLRQGEGHRCPSGSAGLVQSAIVGIGSGAVCNQEGNIFVGAFLCAAVINGYRISRALHIPYGESVPTAVLEGELPLIAAVILNLLQPIGLAPHSGRCEEDSVQIEIESRAYTKFIVGDSVPVAPHLPVSEHAGGIVIIFAGGPQPPVACGPALMVTVDNP